MREEYKLHMKCKLCSEPDEYDSSSSFSHVPYTLFSILSMCLPLLHFPSYTKFSPSVRYTITYNISQVHRCVRLLCMYVNCTLSGSILVFLRRKNLCITIIINGKCILPLLLFLVVTLLLLLLFL